MRYVVVGAGAIGGVIAGRLHEHDVEVVLVARGDHRAAIDAHGLRVLAPEGATSVRLTTAPSAGAVSYRADDTVIVAVKSQDTLSVVREVAAVAPATIAIACAQNGTENERVALRSFERVYGVCVMCPAAYLTPGEVQLFCGPTSGVLDVGRYPKGDDDGARKIASDLTAATFESIAHDDVMLLKWGKLLNNLNNAIEALLGTGGRGTELGRRTHAEAIAALAAHGIDGDAAQTALRERGAHVAYAPIQGIERGGGSSWQSLARGRGDIEADFLNGEIVLMGRLAGVPTPVNEMLQRTANEAARDRRSPGSFTEQELLRLVR